MSERAIVCQLMLLNVRVYLNIVIFESLFHANEVYYGVNESMSTLLMQQST
jgi:hypothetical protein